MFYFNDFCNENNQVQNYYTRKSNDLHKKFNRTNFGICTTRNKVVNVWNAIPNEIKHSTVINVFKRNMKKITSFAVIYIFVYTIVIDHVSQLPVFFFPRYFVIHF